MDIITVTIAKWSWQDSVYQCARITLGILREQSALQTQSWRLIVAMLKTKIGRYSAELPNAVLV